MSVRLLYTSIQTGSHVAEAAVRSAIGERDGDWCLSLISPPRQDLWVVVIDGPHRFNRTWVFDQDEQEFSTVRNTIEGALLNHRL